MSERDTTNWYCRCGEIMNSDRARTHVCSKVTVDRDLVLAATEGHDGLREAYGPDEPSTCVLCHDDWPCPSARLRAALGEGNE